MFLNEFQPDTKIEIVIKVANQKIKLESVILKNIKNFSKKYGACICCKSIIMNKKIINFSKYPATVNVFNKSNNRAYSFKVSASAVNARKGFLYICSKDNAKATDNRSSFRIPCVYKASIKIKDDTKITDCRTHDLSYSGVSFIVKKDEKFNVGDIISISINDNEDHIYKSLGRIVRICNGFDKDSVLLGVRLCSDSLRGLVSRLQIKETRLKKI